MGSIAQEFSLRDYPPFPTGLDTIELQTFSLNELEAGDKTVQDRLFDVCKNEGFFYLDLAGSSASSLPADAMEIAAMAEKAFSLPLEEKMKYAYHINKTSIFGYKMAGLTKADSKGTPDTAEFFNISKDEMLPHQPDTMQWPAPILEDRTVLNRYITAAHEAALKVLSVLESKLGLESGTLASFHRINEPSGDHVRLTRGPPRVSQNLDDLEIQAPGHTDFGTITFLFNWLGGLQVWSAPSRGETNFTNIVDPATASSPTDTHKWLWVVPPKPSCAIVNLGDAAVKFTNGLLCSARHRVVPAPGPQGVFPRYSIVYFVRPEDNTVLKRLEAPSIPPLQIGTEEEDLTAKDWIMKQANALRKKLAEE